MNTKQNPIVGCMRWGTWGAKLNTRQYETMIHECLDMDMTVFDHADIYGDYTTEAEFGQVLKNNSSLRSRMHLITKTGIQMRTANRPSHAIKSYNTSASHIIQSVEQSLQNFQTDYIDTLLIHRPDILLNTVEVAEAINRLKKSGKVKSFGVSNFSKNQVSLLTSQIPVECHQIEISITALSAFNNGILDQCQLTNIAVQAWSPLGNGLFEEKNEKNERILAVAKKIANQYEVGINEILLAFLYTHPSNITPVIGTTKIERIKEAKAAKQINLEREDFYKLWTASTGKEVA